MHDNTLSTQSVKAKRFVHQFCDLVSNKFRWWNLTFVFTITFSFCACPASAEYSKTNPLITLTDH